MFSKLLLPFRFFQTHFTYRQRFIFFSVFFLLSIPIPTYWMLRSQNFFLNRWLLQAESASLQLSAESLLTHLIQAQVELIKPGPSSNFFLLEEQIHSDLKKIAYYESLSYPVPK